MRGTTIFLAGAEVETLTRALLDNGVKHILYSYFYIWQMKRERFIEEMQSQYPEVEWFLDSGAFTYHSKWQLEPHKLPPPKAYAKSYFRYLDRQGHNFCRIAELDIGHVDGVDDGQVDEWREHMLDRWPHLPIVPVWHRGLGMAKWRQWCRDPRIRFLAISGTLGDDVPLVRRLTFEAAKHGKPVHGLAMTKTEIFRRVPLDSADSTSWLSGQKFGTMYAFRHNRMEQLNKDQGKALRKQLRGYFQAIGCDPELMNDETSHLTRLALKRGIPFDQLRKLSIAEIRKGNVLAWKMLSDRMDYLRQKMIERNGTTLPFIQKGAPQERDAEDERTLIGKLFSAETVTREPEYVEAMERKIAPRQFGRERLIQPFLWDDLDDRNPHMAE